VKWKIEVKKLWSREGIFKLTDMEFGIQQNNIHKNGRVGNMKVDR
jgi:hypothetical protein